MHRRDRGLQDLSILLAQAGSRRSTARGTRTTTLAETVIGLFKTEEIRRRERWKGLEDVEFATREWVAWCNGSRPLESRNELSGKPGTVQDGSG